ncbi:MAG: NAD-dependent epimerase/dehydratase family protein [Nitrospira sp.]|nr:NAD-dependent epimerase/dehydratase family protein [Nitrospira sp.]
MAGENSIFSKAEKWLDEDWERMESALSERLEAFREKRVLVTGAAGFLGFGFLHFFSYLNRNLLKTGRLSVVAADNYIRGRPRWLVELAAASPDMKVIRQDITKPWPDLDGKKFDFIIHGASIASPKVYRRYPLETLDTNISGLRHMLELARLHHSESILYFSSSEMYGDPPAHEIPTSEVYRGNVSCLGPRACYDESKRLGETLCYLYFQQHGVRAKIVRPFNNYGPGLRLADGRVLSDFCSDVLADRDIVLRSDGSPTRTFCYVSDALTGYLLALLSAHHAEPFNVGTESPEISMRDLGRMLLDVAGSKRHVIHAPSDEIDYLTDNPNRRCPNIAKARSLLGYTPLVDLRFGLGRMLEWYKRFVAMEELAKDEPGGHA